MARSNASEGRREEKGGERLADLFSALLLLGAGLKTVRDYGSPETLRAQLGEMFNMARLEARQRGIPEDATSQARYAVAAFLDEMILSVPSPHREAWSARPLQYEFFQEQVAGVEFFNRLSTLRQSFDLQRDVIEVFYLCLLLGFEGKYKVQEREKLKELTDELGRQFQPKSVLPLSPNGKPPDELIERVKHGSPAWVVAVFSFALVFLVYLFLSLLIGRDANRIAEQIRHGVEAVGTP